MNTDLDNKKIYHIFSLTDAGCELSTFLTERLENSMPKSTINNYSPKHIRSIGGLKEAVKSLFSDMDSTSFITIPPANHVIVFICATGIAVRMIAPFVKDKLRDPACIVIDDYGNFVISLLSGHIGCANSLTHDISILLSSRYRAIPVITTATDVRGVQGVEELMRYYHIDIVKYRSLLAPINLAIANGEKIGILLDPMLEQKSLYKPGIFKYYDDPILFDAHIGIKIIVAIRNPEHWLCEGSNYNFSSIKSSFNILYSKCIVLGTGCRKNLSYELYKKELDTVLAKTKISAESISMLCTIDIKKSEACINELSKALHIPVKFLSSSILSSYDYMFEGSEFVKSITGAKAVSGPCAFHITGDELSFDIHRCHQCTFSFGRIK